MKALSNIQDADNRQQIAQHIMTTHRRPPSHLHDVDSRLQICPPPSWMRIVAHLVAFICIELISTIVATQQETRRGVSDQPIARMRNIQNVECEMLSHLPSTFMTEAANSNGFSTQRFRNVKTCCLKRQLIIFKQLLSDTLTKAYPTIPL